MCSNSVRWNILEYSCLLLLTITVISIIINPFVLELSVSVCVCVVQFWFGIFDSTPTRSRAYKTPSVRRSAQQTIKMTTELDNIKMPELPENQKCFAGIPEANFVVNITPN